MNRNCSLHAYKSDKICCELGKFISSHHTLHNRYMKAVMMTLNLPQSSFNQSQYLFTPCSLSGFIISAVIRHIHNENKQKAPVTR